MINDRVNQLAKNLVNYSCQVRPGDKVLIENIGLELPIVTALIKEVYRAQAIPLVSLKDHSVQRALLMEAGEEQIKLAAKYAAFRMQEMDAYIGIRSGSNTAELSDVPAEKMDLYMRFYSNEVHSKIRVTRTRWVVLRYPNPSMAQAANMSTEAFEELYFQVCNLDYQKMSRAMDPLVQWLEKTDKIKIVGPGTDLVFSIKGIPVVKCDGRRNIPDGEVYTAPVRDSVNGYITYNTPAVYQGVTYENIRLEFNKGEIVKATANDSERINKVLDTDEGARYIGEFALGFNPYLTKAIKDTLFDEKIAGSFHLTPGNSYAECPNGNKSAIHWDLVCLQTPEYGGGEIYFDEVLIRKDGIFVLPELAVLNPKNLK
ncbi:MAG: aminopeptidase [Syntrophomonadaceae bacterium]|nr:aminopeptidase [Syntrophomonadaceae bacterium]